jgi:hypothetical protein
VGSKTFDGVWFISFAHDHLPPHVHGKYGETMVVIDLLQNGQIRQSARTKSITPRNAKRSDVSRILKVAAAHVDELLEIWEAMHGSEAE